jgi:hypothetical protein
MRKFSDIFRSCWKPTSYVIFQPISCSGLRTANFVSPSCSPSVRFAFATIQPLPYCFRKRVSCSKFSKVCFAKGYWRKRSLKEMENGKRKHEESKKTKETKRSHSFSLSLSSFPSWNITVRESRLISLPKFSSFPSGPSNYIICFMSNTMDKIQYNHVTRKFNL